MKRAILRRWRNDLTDDAGLRKAAAVFEQIPSELARRDAKFRLAALGGDASMRSFEAAFAQLEAAGFANICRRAAEPSAGLVPNRSRPAVKCFLSDTGLLLSHAFDAATIERERLYAKILSGDLTFAGGLLIENAVAQMLRAARRPLYFLAQAAPAAADRFSVDFLLPQTPSRLTPVVVKRGRHSTLSSLRKLVAKYPAHFGTPCVLHDGDWKNENGIDFLPYYMAPLLP